MGPKIERWTPPTVFRLGPLFSQGLLVTYEPTKSWNGFFISGPVLGLGPKRAPKWKKLTPTAFELGPSFFQGLLVTHDQTESRNIFIFILGSSGREVFWLECQLVVSPPSRTRPFIPSRQNIDMRKSNEETLHKCNTHRNTTQKHTFRLYI